MTGRNLREALAKLQAGDTLVIYKPDRVARSMKKLLVLLENHLHSRGINPFARIIDRRLAKHDLKTSRAVPVTSKGGAE